MKPGDRYYYVANTGKAVEVEILKVGRKWISFGRDGYELRVRAEVGTLRVHEPGYGTVGRLYADKAAHDEKLFRDRAAGALRSLRAVDVEKTPLEDLEQALKLLGLEVK